MSDHAQGPGWWQASDGRWYPPETAPPPQMPPQMPPPSTGPYGVYAPAYTPTQTNGIATAGFVCGLVGLIICLIPFGIFLGGVLAILGIVFGFLGRSRSREANIPGAGMATAGIVLSFVGLLIGVLWLVAIGAFVKDVSNHLEINPGDFTVAQQRCSASARGELTATGEITNTTDQNKIFVTVRVEAHDSKGRVVGRGEDFIGDVDSGETQPYTVRGVLDDRAVENLTCTVTVT